MIQSDDTKTETVWIHGHVSGPNSASDEIIIFAKKTINTGISIFQQVYLYPNRIQTKQSTIMLILY